MSLVDFIIKRGPAKATIYGQTLSAREYLRKMFIVAENGVLSIDADSVEEVAESLRKDDWEVVVR